VNKDVNRRPLTIRTVLCRWIVWALDTCESMCLMIFVFIVAKKLRHVVVCHSPGIFHFHNPLDRICPTKADA
jgi:hypothetical protein